MTTRRMLVAVGSFVIAALCLRFAMKGLDWRMLNDRVHQLDWRWLAVAVVFDVFSYVAQGVRWRLLLENRAARSPGANAAAQIWTTTRCIYAGLFINEVLPFRPGEALRAWLVSRDMNIDVWRVVPTLVVERLMDGLWLAVAVLVTLWAAPLPEYFVTGALWVMGVTALGLVALWWARRSRFALLKTVASGMGQRRALLVSAGYLLGQALAFWAVIRASHLPLGLLAAFVAMVIVRVGTLIPGAPANLGTHQFSTVLALTLYGVSQPEAATFSVIVFSVLTAPLLAIGFLSCASAGLSWRHLRPPPGCAAA